jgi:hypothetical protein
MMPVGAAYSMIYFFLRHAAPGSQVQYARESICLWTLAFWEDGSYSLDPEM